MPTLAELQAQSKLSHRLKDQITDDNSLHSILEEREDILEKLYACREENRRLNIRLQEIHFELENNFHYTEYLKYERVDNKKAIHNLAILLNEMAVFYDPQTREEVKQQPMQTKKPAAIILPDLMKWPEKKKEDLPMPPKPVVVPPTIEPQKPLQPKYIPPKKKERIIEKKVQPDPPRQPFIRAKGEYSNRSPYGIASEMLLEQLKRSG